MQPKQRAPGAQGHAFPRGLKVETNRLWEAKRPYKEAVFNVGRPAAKRKARRSCAGLVLAFRLGRP